MNAAAPSRGTRFKRGAIIGFVLHGVHLLLAALVVLIGIIAAILIEGGLGHPFDVAFEWTVIASAALSPTAFIWWWFLVAESVHAYPFWEEVLAMFLHGTLGFLLNPLLFGVIGMLWPARRGRSIAGVQ